MDIYLGLDIGSISAKLAALRWPEGRVMALPPPLRIQGDPIEAALKLLQGFSQAAPSAPVAGIRVTGSGGRLVAGHLQAPCENELKAIAAASRLLYPEVKTIFEMGGETAKFLRLEGDEVSDSIGIVDYETNGDCAAGTGAFIDQQASRLRFSVEEVGGIAQSAPSAARIAGRCSVFAKTDMIHAQQKGYGPPEILRGLCDAVARNFKGSITKGKEVIPPVALIGGVALNLGVVQALRALYQLSEKELFVPREYAWFGAVGAALLEARADQGGKARPPILNWRLRIAELSIRNPHSEIHDQFPSHPPLSLDDVLLLRDRVKPYRLPEGVIDAYLGIDIGSVSTNFALLDDEGNLLKEIYVRTEGRPIEVVKAGLQEIQEELGGKVRIKGVGTTGSGRELIGELVGANLVSDEITAHKTGAMYIGERLTGEKVDTIFEVGGQDSKFIRIEEGIVVDFAMNEACAAGTGSFLEEQAERLGVNIKGEFAELAFSSLSPIRLGERCTVFMERDVYAYQQRGAKKEDLIAGLAYSIALNYLNRVVRGRRIGEVIYFQGGTAYNDAVAAAFAGILKKRIIVPPHNGVVGAIGMALLAREKAKRTGEGTPFRGFDLEKVHYQIREFVCKACPTFCDMQEFTVEGVRTYWGDRCSEKFRRRAKTGRRPLIPDLVALREKLLLEGYQGPGGRGIKVGIPRAMVFFDYFPFFRSLLEGLEADVVLSDPTNRSICHEGIDLSVAEPCFPVKVAHGHVKDLLQKGVDYILLPNILDAEAPQGTAASFLCPWNQTLPFVVRSVPRLEPFRGRFLIPSLHFRRGRGSIERELTPLFRILGASWKQGRRALTKAYEAQRIFLRSLREAGREALTILQEKGEPAVVLVGRGYNLYDKGVNLDILGKLRDYYGINVIPMDFLPLDDEEISDLHENMYWNSGRRILAAGRFVGRHPHLHIIYLTNFKCGPDSFIKPFMGEASGKPYLVLQFDGHSGDAGVLTRCEAYLDSKGMLRWWASQ